MNQTAAAFREMIGNPHRLRAVFANEFGAADIATPLLSFDSGADCAEVARILEQQRESITGVRVDGQMRGYARRADLTAGILSGVMRPFEPAELVADNAPLSAVISALNEHDQVFVLSFGAVAAVVTRLDLEKPPARMWLFGVVTILEMVLSGVIKMRFPDGSWTELISAGRLAKAQELLEQRRMIGQEVELISCLQLADVASIFMRVPELLAMTKQKSRSQGAAAAKDLQQLRDHLAHAQPIVEHNWPMIASISDVLDRTLDHLAREMEQ